MADRPRSVDRRRPSPVAAVDRHAGVGYGIGAPHRRRSVANYQDATRGGRAVVHVPYRALESASASLLDVVTRVGNRLVMADGTIVVPGPGYPGNAGNWGPLTDDNDPDSGASVLSGEVFVYVTGPVQVGLGPVSDRSSDRPGPTRCRPCSSVR